MARKKKNTMPFDTECWLSDPVLKALPLDVKGLWIDMLCYMWESADRGVMVKPTGEIYTHEEILRLLGKESSVGESWLDMLIENGLCGVRDDGAVFSRRMVRDEAIRGKRCEAGKKGGYITKAKVFDVALVQQPPMQKPEEEKPEEQPKQGTVGKQQQDLFPEESPPPLTPEQQAKAEKVKKYKYAEFVTLTRDEYAKLCTQYSEEGAKRMIEILDNYKGSKGKKYKSDYRTILNWVVDRYNEEIQKNGNERSKINGGGGSSCDKGYATATLPFESGCGSGSGSKPPKDYSERF